MRESTKEEIEQALIAAVNADKRLRDRLKEIPGEVERTVREFIPDVTGRTLESLEVKSSRSEFGHLSKRPVTIGEVFSDDDPERIAAIEHGRGPGAKYGESKGVHMFARAADWWNGTDLQ